MPRKPNHIYLPLDVEFFDNERVLRAGEKAGWLYLAMCTRAKRLVTDGKLSKLQIERLNVTGWPTRLRRLVEVGLVTPLEQDVWLIEGFLERNPSAAQLADYRRKDADRKRSQSGRPSDRIPDGIRPDSGAELELEQEQEEKGNQTAPQSVAATPAARKPNRGSRVPDEFPLTADLLAWGREKCPAVDGRSETDNWLDWHRAKGDTAKDWTASWRTWMRRAQKDAETRRPGTGLALVSGNPRPSTRDAAVAQVSAAFAAARETR